MTVRSFEDVKAHFGHRIEVVIYGEDENVAIECAECNEVLIDFDRDQVVVTLVRTLRDLPSVVRAFEERDRLAERVGELEGELKHEINTAAEWRTQYEHACLTAGEQRNRIAELEAQRPPEPRPAAGEVPACGEPGCDKTVSHAFCVDHWHGLHTGKNRYGLHRSWEVPGHTFETGQRGGTLPTCDKRPPEPQPASHVTDEHDDCVPWCPACGPQCEHGNNSLECEQCAKPEPQPSAGEVPAWVDKVLGVLDDGADGVPVWRPEFRAAAVVMRDALATTPQPALVLAAGDGDVEMLDELAEQCREQIKEGQRQHDDCRDGACGEVAICAECGEEVSVDGCHEFEHGDVCHTCLHHLWGELQLPLSRARFMPAGVVDEVRGAASEELAHGGGWSESRARVRGRLRKALTALDAAMGKGSDGEQPNAALTGDKNSGGH